MSFTTSNISGIISHGEGTSSSGAARNLAVPKLYKGGEGTSSHTIEYYSDSGYPPRGRDDRIYQDQLYMMTKAGKNANRREVEGKGKGVWRGPEGDGEIEY